MTRETESSKERNIRHVFAEWTQNLKRVIIEERNIKHVFVEWTRTRALKRIIVDKKRTRFIVGLILLSFLATATLAVQTFRQDIASSGMIKVIGVSLYWDKACTNKVTSVTWGTTTPGTSVNKYLYVLNDGTASGTLSMTYGNWTPAAAGTYITLAWNCSSYVLARNGITCAKLTLTVKSTITGVKDFNFMILIQATG